MKTAFVSPSVRDWNEFRFNNKHLNPKHIKRLDDMLGERFDVIVLGYQWQGMCFRLLERVHYEMKRIEQNEKSK